MARRSLRAAVAAALLCVSFMVSAGGTRQFDLNEADRAQLESLRGIGVEAAERILVEREKGRFLDWADFMRRVKGVKQGMAARFSADGVTVNGQAFVPSAAVASRAASS